MNYYALLPLSGFIINFFTSTYIFSQKRGGPVNQAFTIYAYLLALWMLELFFLWLPVDEQFLLPLERITLITGYIFFFCFVNFTYVFLQKKRDRIYYAILITLIVSIFIISFTDMFFEGYVKHYWGTTFKKGKLFAPIALLSGFLPYLYSIFLIDKKRRRAIDKNTKNQLNLLLQGSIISYSIFLLFDFIIPHVFNMVDVPRLGIPGSVVQAVFIFRAVTKYNFLSISIEEAATDLFLNVRDGVILSDKNGYIIQTNESAKQLFNLYDADLKLLKTPELFRKDYNFNEDYNNHETRINNNGEQKIVSLSQATVKQYDVELGKILIVRDITENEKAKQELKDSKTALENLANELARTNALLEQKVAERTSSLLMSNEKLQREILERQRAEEALAAEKERLAVTLESIGDGVITTDTTGYVVLLNKVAEQLTGWSQAAAIGQPLAAVFHIVAEKTRTPQTHSVAEALHTDEIVRRPQHAILLARDQSERLIAENTAPIHDQDGMVIGAVLVFRDMTERRKIEEELMKADKLESIGVLAGGIAHDFNNILTAIIGNISLAKMYASPEDKVFARLLNAEKASLQAQNLTQQLLTFSKGGSLVRKTSSIIDLVKDCIGFSMRGSNVKCDFFAQENIWPAEVDAGQISQVINNLIINANQAMPDGGVIEVHLDNFDMNQENINAFLPLHVGKYIKISVKDNGIGISEENLQKIFDPYFTTKKKGSGLGLFSCYSIIKKHDGHIAVESTPGVGTTFYVYIPASDKALAHQKDASAVGSTGQGYILIMEDEETIRDVTGEMLSHFGYEVAVAKDGSEAIALYKHARESNRPFDVVIMDLTIPGGMGGKEAIKKILEVDPQAKVVVASGYVTDPIIADFTQYGFCERIAKPYKSEELHTLLHRIITDASG